MVHLNQFTSHYRKRNSLVFPLPLESVAFANAWGPVFSPTAQWKFALWKISANLFLLTKATASESHM